MSKIAHVEFEIELDEDTALVEEFGYDGRYSCLNPGDDAPYVVFPSDAIVTFTVGSGIYGDPYGNSWLYKLEGGQWYKFIDAEWEEEDLPQQEINKLIRVGDLV